MSDTEAKDTTETKKRGRGRPSGPANKEKASPVKRPAEDAAESHEDSGEDDKPKAKRGRGRPKGSGGGAKAAKSPKAKKAKVPGRGRGRPKKTAA
jgi:hypothetical protein